MTKGAEDDDPFNTPTHTTLLLRYDVWGGQSNFRYSNKEAHIMRHGALSTAVKQIIGRTDRSNH